MPAGHDEPALDAAELDLHHLDTGHLAHFAGLALNARVLEILRRQGHPQTRPAHGLVFQHLLACPEGLGVTALAARLGISQQATSKQVAALVRLGYVRQTASATDARQKLLRLSNKAHDLIAMARLVRGELEQQLRDEHGDAAVDGVRTVLAAMIDPAMRAAIRERRVRVD